MPERTSLEASRRALLLGASAAVAGFAGFEVFGPKPERGFGPASVKATPGPFVANPNWFSFAEDPGGRVLVLVGSDGAVLRSTDAGRSFERAQTHVAEPLFSVAIDRATRTIVAVGGNGCLLVSRDGARTFTRRVAGEAHLRRVIASRWGAWLVVGDKGTLLASLDDAQSFKPIPLPTEVNLAFAADMPRHDAQLVAGEHGTIVASIGSKTWQKVELGVDAVITCLLVTAQGSLLVGTDAGRLLRSRDLLRFETASAQGAEAFATSLATSPDGKTLIATTRSGKLLRSRDDGASWTSARSDCDEYLAQASFHGPSASFVAVGNGGTLLRSDPSGVRFERVSFESRQDLQAVQVVAQSGRTLVAGRGGLLGSVDATLGRSQIVLEGLPQYLHQVVCDARGDVLLAVGSAGACVRSSDGGASWSRVALPVPESATLYAVCEHAASRALLIGGSGGILLRSGDGGVRFEPVKATAQSIAAFYLHGERVLALALDEGVLYSDDGGRSFQRARMSEPGSLLAVSPGHEGELVAVGMQGAAYRSSDGGVSWQRHDSGSTAELRAVTRHPQSGELWVVGTRGTVLRSSDGGRSFSSVDVGSQANLLALGYHAASRRLLVAGTQGTLLELSEDALRFESIATGTKEKLRVVLSDPESGDLLVAGSAGVVLRGATARSLRPLFTHTAASFASAVYHRRTRAWVLAGERLLRLPDSAS